MTIYLIPEDILVEDNLYCTSNSGPFDPFEAHMEALDRQDDFIEGIRREEVLKTYRSPVAGSNRGKNDRRVYRTQAR